MILHAIRRQLLTLARGRGKLWTLARGDSINILRNRTLPVVAPTMNPSIYPRVFPIVAAPQTLLMPETKEFATACGGVWVNRNPRKVISTGFGRSAPGDIFNAASV